MYLEEGRENVEKKQEIVIKLFSHEEKSKNETDRIKASIQCE